MISSGATAPPPGDDLEPGPRRLGRYRVSEEVGRGGMSRVFRAHDPELDRDVALKVLRPTYGQEAQTRIVREARAMAQLSHPNVMPVFDVATEGERVFLAMLLIRGQSLAEWLKERRRPWAEVVAVMSAAGKGLAAAHAAGLVHRDFKPSNVLLAEDGRLLVTDFGLVRRMGSHDRDHGASSSVGVPMDDAALTATGTVMGTPAYMAPEQHRDESVDERSDQFSFCMAFYEALVGVRPWSAKQLARHAAARRLPPPELAGDDVPRWLHGIVVRGLAHEPADRWSSMSALLASLERVPKRRRAARTWAMSGAVVTGTLTVGLWSPELDPCGDAESRLGVWNEAHRDRMRRSLLELEHPAAAETWERLSAEIERYAGRWAHEYEAACRATRDEALDGRTLCLERARIELGALVEAFGRDLDAEVLARALDAAFALPDPEHCGEARGQPRWILVSGDPEVAARASEVQAVVARAKAERDAGRFSAALAAASEALALANADELAPLRPEARLNRGRAFQELARYTEAAEDLELAYFEALEHGDERIAAAAAIDLLFLQHELDAQQAIAVWTQHARAASQRARDPVQEARLRATIGIIEEGARRFQAAISAHEAALALLESTLGPDHPDVAAPLSNLGRLALALGDHARAQSLYARACEIRRAAFGPEHPKVAWCIYNLGLLALAVGDYEEAERHHQHALELRRRAYGEQHPVLAYSLNELGRVAFERGQPERALELMHDAYEVRRAVHGDSHPEVVATLYNTGVIARRLGEVERALSYYQQTLDALGPSGEADPSLAARAHEALGNALADLDRLDDARQAHERSLALRLEIYGEDHVETANAMANLALCIRDAPALASQHAERAVEIAERQLPSDHPDLASMSFRAARVLWNAPARGERARALAARASAIYGARGADFDERSAEVDRWLEEHS